MRLSGVGFISLAIRSSELRLELMYSLAASGARAPPSVSGVWES